MATARTAATRPIETILTGSQTKRCGGKWDLRRRIRDDSFVARVNRVGIKSGTASKGSWTFEISRGEEEDKFKFDEVVEAKAQLRGPPHLRRQTGWNNSTILSGDFATEIAKLKQQVNGVILVAGSAQLVQGLIEHDLLDELRLMVFPALLGSGNRIFGERAEKKPLRLVDSKTVGDGVALLTYVPA